MGVTVTGSIGPIRKNLLERAYAQFGDLLNRASEVVRPDGPAPAPSGPGVAGQVGPAMHLARNFTADWLGSAGSGFEDASNRLDLVRMDRGLMSLQVDPRVLDMMDTATLGAMGVTRVGRGLVQGTEQAMREFAMASAGGTRLWAGPKSATWNAGKAAGFEDFEKAGGTREGLWQAFGTGRLKDGSLIQEIDDSKAALKTDFAYKKPLGDVIDHPDFVAAYPQLANDVKVSLDIYPQPNGGRGHGSYNSDTKELTVVASNMDEARRLILHEMQHSISRFEGRATGGSPDKAGRLVQAALDDPTTSPELKQKLMRIVYNDYEGYQLLQDEVLARNVEGRRDMMPEQRETTAPAWDRDPEDWIVSRDTEPGISMGKGYAPKKTVKAYKLFRVDPKQPGKLFPLFVEADKPVPIGEWVEAVAGAPSKDGKGVASKIGQLAYRPGWHAGDLPVATHIGAKSQKGAKAPDTRPDNHVWAEVEMPDDYDWQSIANQRGTNKQGRVVPVKAHITDQIPKNGFYRYKTNPNMTGEWMISGNMRVNRVLDDAEVAAINSRAGVADLPRAKPFDPRAYGFGDNVDMAVDAASSQRPAKTKAALNIGLKIGDTGSLDPEEALQAIRGLGINVTEHGILQSGTEPTLVLGIDRALTPAEAESLSAALRQEAIAQKVGKKGELFGPAKDKWGPFNDDYFLQLKTLRRAADRGEADPPIFDYSLLEKDPGHRIDLPLYDPPRGTPEREARLLRNKGAFARLVEFARKGMTNDGLGWYNTEELRQEFIKEWGAEKGQEQYEKFIDLVGATSAGAKTDANLKIASKYFADNVQGLPPAIPPKGSGYGHKAQNLHFQNAKDILEGKQLDPFEHPKRSRFAANLKGDWTHSTIDKHNVRALAIASRDKEWVATKLEDTKGAGKPEFWNEKKHGEWNPATFNPREFVEQTRMPFDKIPVTWFESAPKGTAYKSLSQLNERLAAELGVTPAQAQAALWLGAGDATGLGSKPIALMKVLDQRLAITARKRKITKREALRQMITGEAPLLSVAGSASLLPLLADDGDGA